MELLVSNAPLRLLASLSTLSAGQQLVPQLSPLGGGPELCLPIGRRALQGNLTIRVQ